MDEEIFNRFLDLKFFGDIPSVKKEVLDWLNDQTLNGGYTDGYKGFKIKYDPIIHQFLTKVAKQKTYSIIDLDQWVK